MLDVRDLRVVLPTARGPAAALRGVSFSLGAGEKLGLIGESGCGKSLTALAIMGLLPEGARVEGSLRLNGQPIAPTQKLRVTVNGFLAGGVRTLVTKPEVLGFGLNLQCATRQVFSTCQDSYEEYHQAVSRSNRVGSTRTLNVHLPVTEIELLVENDERLVPGTIVISEEAHERVLVTARTYEFGDLEVTL